MMTQDCSGSLSTPHVSNRLPKGIHIAEADHESVSGIEAVPWGYLFIHNKVAQVFEREMEAYNMEHPEAAHRCFVHRSYSYKQRNEWGGVKREYKPTISGLVFLQGYTSDLQAFLKARYPHYHLVNDRCKGTPASISDRVMQPFMTVLRDKPERVTFLRDPFEKFAKDHVKLRVLTGLFKGCEGYIVRIDRDRQLVFNFGNYAVAIRGVHNEDFEEVRE